MTDARMTRRRKVLGMVLPLVLVVAHAACSSPVYRASQQMCMAHGGTYSAETQNCSFAAATTVSAQQACQNQAGIYLAEAQRCEFSQ